jgi:hypothetical protein
LGWALALAACDRPAEPARAELEPPPPPSAIAGLPGFVAKSTITFHAAPELPHRLEVAYVFPQRVRWWRGLGEGSGTRRILLYRYGDHAFEIPERSSESVEKHGRDRDGIFLQMELRRAWMMWPDGFEWRGEGGRRQADLGKLGTLRAQLNRDGDLVEIMSLGFDGLLLDSYGLIAWQEHRGRRFPRSAQFSHRGQPIWGESIDSVETAVQLRDRFFLPPDRVEQEQGRLTRAVENFELHAPRAVVRAVALGGALDWESRVAEARALHAQHATRMSDLGFEVEPAILLELDSEGRATHLLLRLAQAPPEPPPDWQVRAGGPALGRLLPEGRDLGQEIGAMVGALGAGRRPGKPYARLGEGGQVQLIVPILE